MSRKDYIAIAAAINNQLITAVHTKSTKPGEAGPEYQTLKNTAEALADVCAAGNDRFDRNRFLTACGF